MNELDHNINKDMNNSSLIDVESLDFSDDQTWLYKIPEDSGKNIDMVDWSLSLDWPVFEDEEYLNTEKELNNMLDDILRNQVLAMPDKHKFDSRTYVKPKKRIQRPSINSIVEQNSNPPSISPVPSIKITNQSSNLSSNSSANKYLTYNKYSAPLGPILRMNTFNLDSNSETSNAIKEYAMKRRSIVQDDDPQMADMDVTLETDALERLSETPTKPINIDLSQPAHNLHNTFNKGFHIINERTSLNMYQSDESLMRMSPPSLVSSLLMESSGTFNPESLDGRKSLASQRDSGIIASGRNSIDPMMTSMTCSILDVKDMNTSLISQSGFGIMDSLPPSLVSSVNSSYIVPNTSKPKDSQDPNNVFSSTTFTHLDQSERLLSARPRHQLYNSTNKRESMIRNSESYTKSREEACQIDAAKVLVENGENKDKNKIEMTETVTLHYSNDKFQGDDAEKENVEASFEKDDVFYKDMGLPRPVDLGKNSLNVTLAKQELNEIIQARQKLSLARKALPSESEKPLPNQVDDSPVKNISNTTMIMSRKNIENASELLSRRRGYTNGFQSEEPIREPPKRNATFKKTSPRASSMDTTVVFVKEDKPIIDINTATLNLVDGEKNIHRDGWGSQERTMVGSSDSTDTATFSSSSPPDSVYDAAAPHDLRAHVASTPVITEKMSRTELMDLHTTISPIYNMIDDKSYTVTKINSSSSSDNPNMTVINTATMVKKPAVKRDILANKDSPERKLLGPATQVRLPMKMPSAGTCGSMAPPTCVPRKTGLPTSKLRQYSSHKDLRLPVNALIPGITGPRAGVGRAMVRRNVYASNPALSPTAAAPPAPLPTPQRRDSYTIAVDTPQDDELSSKTADPPRPALVRQGTETLRRERPQSQLVQPKDLRGTGLSSGVPVAMRNTIITQATQRPYSTAAASQLRITNRRPTSGPVLPKQNSAPVSSDPRPNSSAESRISALPRPSRLPGPRRGLRPPSVYSMAPAADTDHY